MYSPIDLIITYHYHHRSLAVDGFHSSASDPNLQAKYGHIKEVINIAPPPTGAMGSTTQAAGAGGPPQYSMFAGAAPPTYNRYVAYDPNSGPAAPAPPQQHSMGFGMPSFSTNASLPMYGAASPGPPPAVAAPSRVYPPSQTGYGQPPGPYGAPQGVAPTTPPTSYVPPAPTSGKPAGSAPLVNINVFNPATDCDIVTADASSKAIL